MKNALFGALALLLAVSGTAQAADGDLDTTFGNGGLSLAGVSDAGGGSNGCKPVVQPDGKILICGSRLDNGPSGADMLVARFDADGTLDSSFSFDGRQTIDFAATGTDSANGIALQPDGKIVVVGTTGGTAPGSMDFAIARLQPDGTLDPAFGAGTGKTTVEFDLDAGSGDDIAFGVALQPDGKIVVVGQARTSSGFDAAVVRLLTDGTRDSAFNVTGKVHFNFAIAADEQDLLTGVAIDSAGRIVVSAADTSPTPVNQLFMGAARLMPNGTLDGNFHSNGRTTIGFDPGSGTSYVGAFGLALQQDGAIVLSGYGNTSASSTQNFDVAVVRLLPDGSEDAGFGAAGMTFVPFDLEPGGTDAAFGVLEQSDGRLVVAGTSVATPIQYATLVRLRRDGSLDPAFGNLGKKTYDFGLTDPDGQALTGVAVQGSGLVASGVLYVPPGGSTDPPIDCFVMRVDNDDSIFANGFE